MAIAWVASWSNLTDADPCVVNTTAAAGSYLLGGAQTDNNNASDLTGLTAGWTYTHARLATTNDNAGFRSFDKDTAAAGNDSVSISSSSSNTSVGMVHEFTGVDLSTGPLDVAVVTTNTDSAGTNSDINVTPNTAGALVVYMHAVDDSTSSVTTTFSTTSGSTGAWDKKSDLNSGFFHMALGIASWTSGALTVRASSSVSASRSGAVHVLKPAATYALDQKGFRWGVDDANEASHTWEANEDTNITIADNQNRLLRTLVDVTSGEPASIAYTLRYQKNGSGGYTAVPVGATSKPTPVIESGDATESGSNTASGSWAVNYPNASTGDLLIFCISWDDSTNVTDVTEPSGPNGETLSEVNATPATDSGTNIRCKVWYTKATGTWTASTLTFTPSASEQWTASVVRVPAGEFDATTPIGASDTEGGSAAGTAAQHGSFTAGGSDGSGKLCVWTAVDTNPQTVASGFSQVSNTDRGAVSGGFFTRNTAVSDSESFSATNVSTMTSEDWATVAFVVRAPTVNNECYITTSGNIAGGGEATTARLTAPSGKTTSDFVTGRRWDDENGTDTIDITANDYTELEWLVALSSAPSASDFFDFRVYAGANALDTYTVTPRWTIPGGGAAINIAPIVQNYRNMGIH